MQTNERTPQQKRQEGEADNGKTEETDRTADGKRKVTYVKIQKGWHKKETDRERNRRKKQKGKMQKKAPAGQHTA